MKDNDAINGSNISGSDVNLINGSDINAMNGSNFSAKNNSDVYQMNNSDTSAINGSDIVVVKLLFEPYNPPSPKITGVKVDPPEGLPQEGNITISITVTNEGGNASEGNISISFPGKDKIEGVEGTGSIVNISSEGNSVLGKDGEITAQYPLVELVEYEWNAGQEETLNVAIIPNNETEELVFFVRAELKDDRTETYRRDPLTSPEKDQQGFDVYSYSFKL